LARVRRHPDELRAHKTAMARTLAGHRFCESIFLEEHAAARAQHESVRGFRIGENEVVASLRAHEETVADVLELDPRGEQQVALGIGGAGPLDTHLSAETREPHSGLGPQHELVAKTDIVANLCHQLPDVERNLVASTEVFAVAEVVLERAADVEPEIQRVAAACAEPETPWIGVAFVHFEAVPNPGPDGRFARG